MFKRELADKLRRIFDLKKATFEPPGESDEQDCVFIQVEKIRPAIKDGRALATVAGKIKVFGNPEKLPFLYFSKKIKESAPADSKDLFFHDIEDNVEVFESGQGGKEPIHIAERTISFVYFFNGQYNPDTGTITSLTDEDAT